MISFHSQNVLQILENMKPIIFRISITDDGRITFIEVEGMTVAQAYEQLLSAGWRKTGVEPVIPIIRVSFETVGAGYNYTMDFIATPVISFSSDTKPLAFTLATPAIPREVSNRLEFDASLYGKGRMSGNVFIGMVINANGNVTMEYFEN